MLNNSFKMYRPLQIMKLLHKTLHIQRNNVYIPQKAYACLCGQVYLKKIQNRNNLRVHSTQSDQHRQKVVIETSTPKIIYEDLKHKVLPDAELASGNFWKEKVDPYIKLARWDRPIGIYLLYWPCTWSIALGSIPGNVPIFATLQTAGLFLIGAGLMRGAGCTINDLWDRDVDAQVERTKSRPLVTGAISHTNALVFLSAQLSLALAVLMQLNCYSVVLGASSMLLVVTYPLAKRFTNYPQIFLGATFNWGALLGYSAVQGSMDLSVCGPLYAGALAWTVFYDTIYAHQDKEDDRRVGIKSTALTFGKHTRPALYATLATSLLCLAEAGRAAELGIGYNIALMAFAAHGIKQIHTLDTENPDDCAKKFKSNSLCGLIILLGVLTGGYSKYMNNKQSNAEQHATGSCFFS